MVKKRQPHLIFMAMWMPVMDGYEATKVIKAQELEHEVWIMKHGKRICCHSSAYKSIATDLPAVSYSMPHDNTVIIALTASAFFEERQQILPTGCDDFVRKPFIQEILLETVSRYLDVKYISKAETTNTKTVNQKTQIMVEQADILRDLSQMSSE